MRNHEHTEIGGIRGPFPTTHWSMLGAVQGSMTESHQAVLNLLIQRYWKPVYCYIRRKGRGNEDAKDLAQDFFTSWLAKDLFGRADPSRGRFRALLLSSRDNFLSNANRASRAKRRQPAVGIVSLDTIAEDKNFRFEPSDNETPEGVFVRVWIRELLMRVLASLDQECQETGKQVHFQLFQQCIVQPALEGKSPPSLDELARSLNLSPKEASNRLITARRAYQRLLREEIGMFASSEEDVAAEVHDLFRFLSEM